MSDLWQLFANPESSDHDADLDGLAKSARKSFGIIELWQKQRSFDNPLVKATVDRIVKQGPAYYRAIHQSAETAQNGCSFARDAIDFCQRLLRAEDSVDTLKSGLEDIKQVAKIAHQGSTEMNKLFKLVRTELFQISKDIPSEIITSRTDRDVLTQLERAKDDLNVLIQHVCSFVDWWGDMNTSLANLEEILPRIKVDGTNPFRTIVVKERWVKVHNEYVAYKREISEVEDYYKNLSGDFPAPPSASEIERLSVDETVAAMLAEQRRRKDEAKRLAEEKRKAEEKRMAEIDLKRQDFEVNPKYQGVIPTNEKAPEEKNRVGEERNKAEEGRSNDKKQGARWGLANADKRPTEEAGGSVDGGKAAEEEARKPKPAEKEKPHLTEKGKPRPVEKEQLMNGKAVTDQHAPTKAHKTTKQWGAKKQKPGKQQATKKPSCCIIM
ncbi:hypothetical protein PILCRDRAFT_816762 [Piloderma croceum F 1598]|uniref:Uncharacterized protein n=1 Tax=Piloderma croceum (strain F 1598) TaxID=765440 RepID=A0A0C3FN01_PILCF|nr:hypothetical protein PILCRDRAFT_816762 [Piloderma croceum F 1598]